MSESEFLQQIRENQSVIYKLVSLYARDAEEKKDLYQEILLNTWKGWHSFRGDAKFSTWLYRICLNTIFTQKRKKHVTDYKESMESLRSVAGVDPSQKEETMRLRQAIRLLSETDRAIISMHLDGYDNSEIAGVLGITKNGVAVKLHRGKEQLANMLKK